MPELPDIAAYLIALEPRVVGQPLEAVRIASPFLVRSVEPRPADMVDKRVAGLRRLGKRIVFAFEDEVFFVFHLMVAGRFRWRKPGAKPPGRVGLAAFDFPGGALVMTEASKKKRASLYVVKGEEALSAHDPGGVEVLECGLDGFRAVLQRENHTIKRTLTDPRFFSGIGNAYSDEILHRAGLSPLKWTLRLSDDEIERLFGATQSVLTEWVDRLGREAAKKFPEKVTAFRPEMAAHGKYREPCPVCETPIQRIRYADNETNYCPTCQTGGKLLADRGLSRLLKKDWPKTLDELEQLKASHVKKLSR